MGATVVGCQHLDVFVGPAVVCVAILDADVGEVSVAVEVRQVVLAGPLADLVGGAVGMPVEVVVFAVAFVEPALVFALQLVVQDQALDVNATLPEGVRSAVVRPVDLDVVFELSLAPEAGVEALRALCVAVAVGIEQALACFC